MALRRCWRIAGAAPPRLAWRGAVRPAAAAASVPGGGSAVSSLGGCRPVGKPTAVMLRSGFSSAPPPDQDVTYEQLKRLLAAGKAAVIDVREPWELREYGFIPGAINVPLGQVNSALQLGPHEFKEKYGGEMPEQNDVVVFTCLAGIRSKSAVEAAVSLGYKDVQHYPGGWKDWAKNEKNI